MRPLVGCVGCRVTHQRLNSARVPLLQASLGVSQHRMLPVAAWPQHPVLVLMQEVDRARPVGPVFGRTPAAPRDLQAGSGRDL